MQGTSPEAPESRVSMTTECRAPQKAAHSPPKISHKAPGDLTRGYTGQWGPRNEEVVRRLVHGRQGGTDTGRVPSSLTGSAQAPRSFPFPSSTGFRPGLVHAQ